MDHSGKSQAGRNRPGDEKQPRRPMAWSALGPRFFLAEPRRRLLHRHSRGVDHASEPPIRQQPQVGVELKRAAFGAEAHELLSFYDQLRSLTVGGARRISSSFGLPVSGVYENELRTPPGRVGRAMVGRRAWPGCSGITPAVGGVGYGDQTG